MSTKYSALYLYSAVQTEVVTLAEAKMAIKIDSTNFDDNITVTAVVTSGHKDITAGATGTGISISGKKCLVVLEPISISAGGTVDVTIQESLDNSTYTDWASGAFTQVTTASGTTYQEIEYTGEYPYIRVTYDIAAAQANFTVNFILSEATSIEDDYIQDLITAAREHCEEVSNRAIGSQVWKMCLDAFPDDTDEIIIPFPPLLSVTSVNYINSTGTSATFTASESTGYIVDTYREPGRIFLAHAATWPSYTEYPYNSVEILYTCGYTATTIPKKYKDAILKMVGALYQYRDTGIPKPDMDAINNLLQGRRVINVG
jgi:uncharacterized phiE125 gp8 family phage protein